jgi:hypothetical protein
MRGQSNLPLAATVDGSHFAVRKEVRGAPFRKFVHHRAIGMRATSDRKRVSEDAADVHSFLVFER